MSKVLFYVPMIILLVLTEISAAEVYVAINKSNPSVIDEKKISQILKAESLSWQDGGQIILLMNDLDSIDGAEFGEVTKMSKSQFMEYWRIKFFSGRALIPKQLKSQTKAVPLLLDNQNTIYISIGKKIDEELQKNASIKIYNFSF